MLTRFGRLDGAVANAGVLKLAPVDVLEDGDWNRITGQKLAIDGGLTSAWPV